MFDDPASAGSLTPDKEDEVLRQMKELGLLSEEEEKNLEKKREESPLIAELFESLPFNSQQAMVLFQSLPDIVDGMGPGWVGKDLSSLEYVMDLLDIIDRPRVFELFLLCSGEYRKYCNKIRERETRKVTRR